jgi:HSP20 family molecular chaperone IbpA
MILGVMPMRPIERKKQAWGGRCVKIVPAEVDWTQRIHDALCRRAYSICEARGRAPGHEMEDWRRAESAVVSPLPCGFMTLEDKISIDTDAASFGEGEIEVRVEPRRITICGKARASEEKTTAEKNAAREDVIFRALDLPVTVDPSKAAAQFNGRILQIDLPRIQATPLVHRELQAA